MAWHGINMAENVEKILTKVFVVINTRKSSRCMVIGRLDYRKIMFVSVSKRKVR